MKIVCNKSNPPLGGLLALELYRNAAKNVEIVWEGDSAVTLPNSTKPLPYGTSNDLIRILENAFNKSASPLERLTMNHWLSFSLIFEDEISKSVDYLDKVLGPLTYLVGESLSVSDLAVFSVLYVSNKFKKLAEKKPPKNILRWMKLIQAQEPIANTLKELPADVLDNHAKASTRKSPNKEATEGGPKQEGKFIELPHAEMGKVVVRFPPEASGYLHIGHAKAALLNQYYQKAFEGKLIMRFDDTNPAKENAEFEKVILEDVEMLEIKPDMFTHTSQYFDMMLDFCEKLIKESKAYVDDTPAEQMKNEREQKIESRNRNNSVEKNLQLWEEMKKGTSIGIQNCVRAKIDMQSMNGCMRDPTIYRCKPEEHPRTGTQYKVYPTYDFACPIVDAVEGVTHVLRTMEYHDRDPQFYWFIDALGLRKPYIWEYSRLSMTNTVLSKRKLTWFVENGLVDGWDDPRMPTVRGVLRRGMTVEGLRQFITAQGSSRSVVFMEWDKIWAINKKVIDPIAPRYTTLGVFPVRVYLKNTEKHSFSVPLHPKNPELGNKTVWVAPEVIIDPADARALKEGEHATFINFGNVMINKINKGADGEIISIEGTPDLENKDYRKTLKLTWLCEFTDRPMPYVQCVYFDHLISKPLLGKDEDFKQYVGHQTRWEVPMLGEHAMVNLRKGDIIQLQRRGYFRVDIEPTNRSPHSCLQSKMVLFHIPEGHSKMLGHPKYYPQERPEVHLTKEEHFQVAAGLDGDIIKQSAWIEKLTAEGASASELDDAKIKLSLMKQCYKRTVNEKTQEASTENQVAEIVSQIKLQGEKVRKLKAEKAEKAVIDVEVKNLLNFKAQYKALTGTDWTPKSTAAPETKPSEQKTQETSAGNQVAEILSQITRQGEKVRKLKAEKAEKAVIDVEVKNLLNFKAQYKALTGTDWTPKTTAALKAKPAEQKTQETSAGNQVAEILSQIALQGDKVRKLKAEKAEKNVIDVEVKNLLNFKAQYKALTGTDWTPKAAAVPEPKKPSEQATTAPKMNASGDGSSGEGIAAEVAKQGEVVRELKTKKADKAIIDAEVKKLLALKAQYQAETGNAYPAAPQAKSKDAKAEAKPKEAKPKEAKPKDAKPKEKKEKPKDAKKEAKPKEPSPKPGKEESSSGVKKITRLGLEACKETDLPEWYSQVITKSEMIDYYDISGCYILRPWSYSIWDAIRTFLSTNFKKLGVKDGYFPIFVSKAALEREKTHIADFAPEVAWVTHSGSSELAEHIAVRPTSETVMYPAYAKWIQSHRDLPLRLNQWNNVVRWEFKQPQPFLRTREFLWQEGHTAFRTAEEAGEEVLHILDLYRQVYEDLLAIPVIRGRKTEKEKFAGSAYTTTVEAYIPASGRGIQGATSHHLGQNFSKMFEIIYDDPDTQEKKYVYQNSWGLTTRTIGVMILVHGDNQGLVLPPRVAEIQAIVVPCGITASSTPEERKHLIDSCKSLVEDLIAAGIRAEGDYRDNYSPGWKFNHWELKGVPIRVELGPKDISRGEIVAVRRLTGEKLTLKRDAAAKELIDLLETTHKEMLAKATKERDERVSHVTQWEEFTDALERRHILLAPFCGDPPCEDNIKNDSARMDDDPTTEVKGPAMGAKSLCIPFDQPRPLTDEDRCIHPACQNKPKFITLFGRSY